LPRDFCRLLGLGCPKQAFAKIVARLYVLKNLKEKKFRVIHHFFLKPVGLVD
jgi:hypothetical protein